MDREEYRMSLNLPRSRGLAETWTRKNDVHWLVPVLLLLGFRVWCTSREYELVNKWRWWRK